ncbi:uncharacterized protein LY89DRAFT_303515 [Mollisia scopiformis]|uniref:Uncharacterized protein n=1 Tax=Mollisia scopiformis TaxID=149040 RepID=A0A194XQV2_MOLSC|nr:uncharacterized protein LY89DRAFT_303515 [Mollisia scopiformis]KUJ22551.1 hypothetical protein LY89DRAFT_303515 [Mollisia scopiformis]
MRQTPHNPIYRGIYDEEINQYGFQAGGCLLFVLADEHSRDSCQFFNDDDDDAGIEHLSSIRRKTVLDFSMQSSIPTQLPSLPLPSPCRPQLSTCMWLAKRNFKLFRYQVSILLTNLSEAFAPLLFRSSRSITLPSEFFWCQILRLSFSGAGPLIRILSCLKFSPDSGHDVFCAGPAKFLSREQRSREVEDKMFRKGIVLSVVEKSQ